MSPVKNWLGIGAVFDEEIYCAGIVLVLLLGVGHLYDCTEHSYC